MSTIQDVARLAGVGVGTVSRFLNGGQVSPATAERVAAAVADLGYTPNRAARGLSIGRTPTIAVLAPFLTQPATFERIRSMIESARATSLPVSVFDVETPADLDGHLDALTRDMRPEALVIVSLPLPDPAIDRLLAADLRPILVDVAHPKTPSLVIDDRAGGRLATEHLMSLGHRRIGFVGDDESSAFAFTSSRERRAGYRAALAAGGLPQDRALESLAQHGQVTAQQAAWRLLAAQNPPTAIVCASDTQALGVLAAARDLSLRVPGDLSVIGFDDIDAAGLIGLTTVQQPLAGMSERAIELVHNQLRGQETAPEREQFPLRVRERGTTSPWTG